MSARTNSRIGLYAIVAATTATLIAPLLAIAYFATTEGAEYLEVTTVAAWAVPARDLVGGLVTWASADRAYATYTQVLAVMFPAVFLTAWATRTQRPQPRKRSERVGWRIALVGYGMFAAGLLVSAVLLIPADTSSGLVDVGFLALMVPGILLSVIGSTVLGVVFLRSGYQPRLTAWLLALALPLLLIGSVVLGHNGLGLVPLFIAWAGAGWRLRAAHETPTADQTDRALARHATTTLGTCTRLLVGVVAVLLLAAGCGNDGGAQTGDQAGETIPQAEAVAQVTQRCAQVNAAFEDLDFGEEPGRVADELEGFAADVGAMPPPAQGQEAFESLVAALEDSADSWRAADEAPEEDKQEAVGAAYDSFEPAEEAAVAFGVGPLQDCGRQAADADPDAQTVELAAREYEFDIPETVPDGGVAFVLRNDGEEPHEMVLVRFIGEETVADVFAAEQAGESPREYVEDIGDSATAAPGEQTVLNADLSPGRYAMLCFIDAPDGEPHALKGMHAEFTVDDA